jgi:prepilin-type N-terminal cleavage/methylation domain-containing protein/prepilin-type processing-associated H-X9-DG protein
MHSAPAKLTSRTRRPDRNAFTLVELLAVIAIVGILAAIVIPTISKVRASAHTANCLGNLRQLGVAGLLYAKDNRGKLFPYRGDNQDNGWNWLLMPYAGATHSYGVKTNLPVFICPSSELKVEAPSWYPRFTYAINNTLTARNATSAEPRLEAVPNPAQVLFFGDSGQNPNWSGSAAIAYRWPHTLPGNPDGILSPATDPDIDSNGNNGYFRYRHNGASQAVFLDGSTRSFKPAELRNRNYWSY